MPHRGLSGQKKSLLATTPRTQAPSGFLVLEEGILPTDLREQEALSEDPGMTRPGGIRFPAQWECLAWLTVY